jgi:hypothetical protein
MESFQEIVADFGKIPRGTLESVFRLLNYRISIGRGPVRQPGIRSNEVARVKRFASLPAFVAILTISLSGVSAAPIERVEGAGASRKSLDLAINGVGVSFGNSPRFTGLRFNLVDKGVEEIDGINITLWKTEENSHAVIRGVSAGLYAPRANELNGIQIGVVNIAKNNPSPFRVLPIVNVHFE